MPAYRFAKLEQKMANAVMATFANIALLDADDNAIDAVLDEAEATMGDFDLTHQKRKTLTFNNTIGLQTGAVLSPNPLQYTPAEIAAMPTSYTLDKLAEDDAYQQTWWVL